MKIEDRLIGSILPYARNPRRNENAIGKVAASIKEFGFRVPIVVDKEGTIVAGHTRLEAAQRLGLKTVPVHVAEDLNPSQAKAYRLADNRVAQESEWDMELLKLELEELRADFDLDLTGFNPDELDSILAEAVEGMTDPDEIPEVGEDALIVYGDLIDLGKHRIKCGDATNAEHVSEIIGTIKPLLMVTDPPYGINYDPEWRNKTGALGVHDRAEGIVQNDHDANWSDAWALFTGDVAYVWHADNKAHIVAESLLSCNFELRAQIIWAKNQFVIGRGNYHPHHEPCWYAVRGTANWNGDRTQSTLWQIDKNRKSETGHSTQKPVECMKRPIENNSSPGQAIYDPFLGSGTTIIAAEMTGRQCIGLEIEPHYCDVIIARWCNFTGKDEVKINGKTVSWVDHRVHKAA